jgi:hypothetical protein
MIYTIEHYGGPLDGKIKAVPLRPPRMIWYRCLQSPKPFLAYLDAEVVAREYPVTYEEVVYEVVQNPSPGRLVAIFLPPKG